jgi:hypothetical protein
MHNLQRALVHDWPIMLLMVVTLTGIGMYLGVGPETNQGTGYRVINIKEVQRLLDAGTLNLHEADWYQHDTGTGTETGTTH